MDAHTRDKSSNEHSEPCTRTLSCFPADLPRGKYFLISSEKIHIWCVVYTYFHKIKTIRSNRSLSALHNLTWNLEYTHLFRLEKQTRGSFLTPANGKWRCQQMDFTCIEKFFFVIILSNDSGSWLKSFLARHKLSIFVQVTVFDVFTQRYQ